MGVMKSLEHFNWEFEALARDEYTQLSPYLHSKEKITLRHNDCGLVYEVTPSAFLSGQRCPKCAIKEGTSKKTKTHAQFVEEVRSLGKGDYQVMSPYQGVKVPVRFLHRICGHSYETLPSNFLTGTRCPECARWKRKRHKTTAEFQAEIQEMFDGEYTVLGIYQLVRIPILVRHEFCGTEFEVTPHGLTHGQHCPNCTRVGTPKRTTESFKQKVMELTGDEYEVVSNYTRAKESIEMKHVVCGITFKTTPDHFVRGKRCPNCARKKVGQRNAKTPQQFEEEVFELVGEAYQILTPYVRSKEKVKMRHLYCETEYDVMPNDFLRGRRCPYCARVNRRFATFGR